jgi:hypothetical protein
MKFEENKTQAVWEMIRESVQEIIDQTGEIPTLYAETIADELAYRQNETSDDYFLVLVEKALDELQTMGLIEVDDNNKVTVL